MNINNAQDVYKRIGRIAELAAIFNARYGNSCRLNETSPAEAWELYRQFMAEQAIVASHLETSAVANPYVRWEKWWESRDVMNIGLVNELADMAVRLLEHIAYLEATGKNPSNEHSVMSMQESIAGLLHPATRQQGISHLGNNYQEAV